MSTSTPPSSTTCAPSPEPSAAPPRDVTVCVLNRPRHQQLIQDVRAAGARIKLFPDGDVAAAIAAVYTGTGTGTGTGTVEYFDKGSMATIATARPSRTRSA